MDTDFSQIEQLVKRPGESLSVELKRWIDPDSPEGKEKIVRAALAFRNHGGGYLVVGFDDKTLKPDKDNVPSDVRAAFHVDTIQSLITKFASETFEIGIEFPERDGQLYPVIVIPPGVKTPVAAKSELPFEGGNISVGDVYVRSLQSNNTPSTTKAGWKDWPNIVEVCFENREADIGRFLRRHLGGLTSETVREIASSITKGIETHVDPEEFLQSYLQECEKRFQTVVGERNVTLPEHGSWEVALLLIGDIPKHSAIRSFLQLLGTSNPNYTGWPVWADSNRFADKNARPHVYQGVWEAFIFSPNVYAIDFWRMDPQGRFYLRRALEDDLHSDIIPPMTNLDFGLPIIRSAEAIAVGLAFAKVMGCAAETTQLAFAFRWNKLQTRHLLSWANPRMYVHPWQAYNDEASSYVNVPLDTPLSALGAFVHQAVQPLFAAFDGYEISIDVVEELTRRLIERRLR